MPTARRLGLPAAAGVLFVLDTASLAALGTEHGRPATAAWNVTGASRHPAGRPQSAAVPTGRG
ncbi:hypothetical protein [Streptomyces sp. NRRL S-31]|uniref:hypothetical protein n=1 Tax=Streptomyces sp. NRRL S-31 TaxID=1463898 RepID=UPI00069BE739|nr:hypothetical protein [Streptomyces sp. NRRL S-31]